MPVREFEGHVPLVDPRAWIDPTALVIGDVHIGPDSSVWPYTVIRGDVNRIRIGSATNIQDHCVLHVSHDGPVHPGGADLQIGNSVTVGHGAVLHGCRVMNHCLIGMRATVLDGAVIEPLAIIGAGALVPPGKTLESGHLWLGTPVRRVRALTREEIDNIEYSAQHYVRLTHRHMASGER